MIYVYIKNWWIIKKSETIVNWISYDAVERVDYGLNDKLIYENWRVVKYDINSKQYRKDHDIDTLEEKIEKLETENEELKTIANSKVKKDLELKDDTDIEYKRKLYLLKNMKWLQHL